MDKKKVLLLSGALIIAIATALAARSMFAGSATPQAVAIQQPAETLPKVLVAQRALPVGTIIAQDSFAYQAWPKDMVKDVYFIEGQS